MLDKATKKRHNVAALFENEQSAPCGKVGEWLKPTDCKSVLF